MKKILKKIQNEIAISAMVLSMILDYMVMS